MKEKVLKTQMFACPACGLTCTAQKVQVELGVDEEEVVFGGITTTEGLRIDLSHARPACETYRESEKQTDHIPAFMQLAIVKQQHALQQKAKAQ